MCSCKEVRLVDVSYRMGSRNDLIPYHKDCGEELSEDQAGEIDRLQLSKWGLA